MAACQLEAVRVFVVEDNAILAIMLEDMLGDLGCAVAAIGSDLAGAKDIAATVAADVAVLDINIAGEASFPVADILAGRGIPFVFATGYNQARLPERFGVAPFLSKPFLPEELEQVMLDALGR